MTALEFRPEGTRAEIENLRRGVSLPDTAAGFGVALQKDGNEWVALCPFHVEDTPSFTIFTGRDNIQRYHCFGCGEHGDVLDFVQAVKGVDLQETVRILGGGKAGPNIAPRKVKVRDMYAGIVPLDPPAGLKPRQRVNLYNPKRAGTEREWGSFVPSLIFPYRRADGSLLGYVLRHELPDGGKETPMVMWVRLPDGKECWSRFPFPKPRPLYGLDKIGDTRQVIVVEGEKCRAALAKATGRAVVTWPGGSQGVKHADWSPLTGRNIVIWPDADGPGLSTAREVAGIVSQLGCTTRVMSLPAGDCSDAPYAAADWQDGKAPPKGWDVADAVREGWGRDDVDAFMRATAEPWTPAEKPAETADEPTAPFAGHSPLPPPPQPAREALGPSERPVPIAGPALAPKPRLVEEPGDEPCTRPSAPSSERPVIYVVKGEIHEAVDMAVKVLSNPTLGIYARGDDLVRAVKHSTPRRTLTVSKQEENIERQDGSVVITILSEAALVETLTRHARFVKWSGNAKDYVPCDCPLEVARMVLALRGHGWTVPRLRAVICAPTLRHNGSIINEPGYDAASGLLLIGDRLWRPVPDSPTKRDALDALDVLMEPIGALPFVDNSDRAAAVALLITSVMRPSLKTAPMFAVTAPAAGTGKSLTVDIAAIMATGRKAAVVTPTSDEAELDKRIGAAALAGDQIISIDNVTHILKSDQLCQMLSQEEVLFRILGLSKSVRIPSTSLICATGNNLSIYGDLNRRTIRIRLDAKEERPEAREFKFDPCELALRKRAELVAAALTIVRAYLSAGAPRQTTPLGSFEDWSNIVRSALIWLDMSDCCGDVDEMRAEDPEKAQLAEIIDAMPPGLFTVKEIARHVVESPEMREALREFIDRGGVLSTKKFSRYLSRYRGTLIGGRAIELVKRDYSHGSVWRISSPDDPRW